MTNKPTQARAAVLAVGTDAALLETRRAVLASAGYAADVAFPQDVDERLATTKFDLVILSVLLGEAQQMKIQARLPAGTAALRLERLVPPRDLLDMVGKAVAK